MKKKEILHHYITTKKSKPASHTNKKPSKILLKYASKNQAIYLFLKVLNLSNPPLYQTINTVMAFHI